MAILFKPNEKPRILESTELTDKKIVELIGSGYTVDSTREEFALVYHEDGGIRGMQCNRSVYGKMIVGSFILADCTMHGVLCPIVDKEIIKELIEKYDKPFEECIKVLYVEPFKLPRVIWIHYNLKSLQKAVGGYIETIYPYEDSVALICNEDAIALGLPFNRIINREKEDRYEIYGNFLLTGLDEQEFVSLSNALIHKYFKLLKYPENHYLSKKHS